MVMGELPENVDIAVVGGGVGGYVAAIRAAELGMSVALVEKEKLGGHRNSRTRCERDDS